MLFVPGSPSLGFHPSPEALRRGNARFAGLFVALLDAIVWIEALHAELIASGERSLASSPLGASSFTRAEVGVCFLRLVPQTQATLGPAMAEHSLRIEREALSGSPGGAFFVGASPGCTSGTSPPRSSALRG
jgi:hypothetical protein